MNRPTLASGPRRCGSSTSSPSGPGRSPELQPGGWRASAVTPVRGCRESPCAEGRRSDEVVQRRWRRRCSRRGARASRGVLQRSPGLSDEARSRICRHQSRRAGCQLGPRPFRAGALRSSVPGAGELIDHRRQRRSGHCGVGDWGGPDPGSSSAARPRPPRSRRCRGSRPPRRSRGARALEARADPGRRCDMPRPRRASPAHRRRTTGSCAGIELDRAGVGDLRTPAVRRISVDPRPRRSAPCPGPTAGACSAPETDGLASS